MTYEHGQGRFVEMKSPDSAWKGRSIIRRLSYAVHPDIVTAWSSECLWMNPTPASSLPRPARKAGDLLTLTEGPHGLRSRFFPEQRDTHDPP
jgi:hypothetical protein